ncbi:hypothetical protein QQZ08_005108 [Neonectria magnoliae]|uniref:Uncharacterized protein n=1 Tax=Neonectria magnoliae TaxID=2732573 RepID=A0ABR1I4D0_9HYPO
MPTRTELILAAILHVQPLRPAEPLDCNITTHGDAITVELQCSMDNQILNPRMTFSVQPATVEGHFVSDRKVQHGSESITHKDPLYAVADPEAAQAYYRQFVESFDVSWIEGYPVGKKVRELGLSASELTATLLAWVKLLFLAPARHGTAFLLGHDNLLGMVPLAPELRQVDFLYFAPRLACAQLDGIIYPVMEEHQRSVLELSPTEEELPFILGLLTWFHGELTERDVSRREQGHGKGSPRTVATRKWQDGMLARVAALKAAMELPLEG